MFDGMEKPIPTFPPERERMALLMPTTSPDMFTRGPPEFPGLMAASVWRKSSKGPWPMERPLALMMPAVTVCWRPNGEPPVAHLDFVRVAEGGRRVGGTALEAKHGEVGALVEADDLSLVLLALRRHHLDVGSALDHVRIGEADARGIHDHPRAETALLLLTLGLAAEEATEELVAEELLDGRPPRPAPRERIDVDHGGANRFRDLGEAAVRDGHGSRHHRRRPPGLEWGGLHGSDRWSGRGGHLGLLGQIHCVGAPRAQPHPQGCRDHEQHC